MCKKDRKAGVPDSGVINSKFDEVTRYPQHPFLALSATLMPFHDNPAEISSAMLAVDLALGGSALNGPAAKLLERATTEKKDKSGNIHHAPTEKAADFIARIQHEVKMTLAQLEAQGYPIISLENAVSGKTNWHTDVHMVPAYVQCYTNGPDGLVINNLLVCNDKASIKAFLDGLHAHTSPDDWTEIPLTSGETINVQNTAIAGLSARDDGALAMHLVAVGSGRHQHTGPSLKLEVRGDARALLDTWMEKATSPKAAQPTTTASTREYQPA